MRSTHTLRAPAVACCSVVLVLVRGVGGGGGGGAVRGGTFKPAGLPRRVGEHILAHAHTTHSLTSPAQPQRTRKDRRTRSKEEGSEEGVRVPEDYKTTCPARRSEADALGCVRLPCPSHQTPSER